MRTLHSGTTVPKFAPADDFTPFCEAVRAICGVDLLQYKRVQTEPAELDAFLDRVTINVSQLWRHPEQWSALARTILPDLAGRGHGRLRAWSAGCSYGAEAYTLAAVCREAIPAARVEIAGTDLDRRMVARAREGRFSAEDARGAPRDAIARFFPGGEATAELKRLVSFD